MFFLNNIDECHESYGNVFYFDLSKYLLPIFPFLSMCLLKAVL